MLCPAYILGARNWGITASSEAADGQTFDYIIIGAGLAGITVAARLVESPEITILVVEAGGDTYQSRDL